MLIFEGPIPNLGSIKLPVTYNTVITKTMLCYHQTISAPYHSCYNSLCFNWRHRRKTV